VQRLLAKLVHFHAFVLSVVVRSLSLKGATFAGGRRKNAVDGNGDGSSEKKSYRLTSSVHKISRQSE
jgi:hypothetical protein